MPCLVLVCVSCGRSWLLDPFALLVRAVLAPHTTGRVIPLVTQRTTD